MSMLVNLTPFPATTFSMLDSDARQFDVVVASATFEARSGQPVRIAEEQSPIREVDEFRGEPGRSSVRHEGQIAPEKARVDVLVEREGSRSRVGGANDRPCESTRYLLYEIALALEPPTVVSGIERSKNGAGAHDRAAKSSLAMTRVRDGVGDSMQVPAASGESILE